MNNLLIILIIAGVIFWLVELMNMLSSRMSKRDKAMWFILFIVASLITAISWYSTKPRKTFSFGSKRGRR